MTEKITHTNFNGKLDHKVMLRKLVDNPHLIGVSVICFWDDDAITIGWSTMDLDAVALGSFKMQKEILERM